MISRTVSRRAAILGALGTATIGARALAAQDHEKTDSGSGDDDVQATATPTDQWKNEHFGTLLEWTEPWKLGVIFGGSPMANKSPILNHSSNDDFALFSTIDPLTNFDRAGAWLDKVEADLSTLFLAPFRDGARDVVLLRSRRLGVSYAALISYVVDKGPVIELYDYQYDKETKLGYAAQLSAFADSARVTYLDLRTKVWVNGANPVPTIEETDILRFIEE